MGGGGGSEGSWGGAWAAVLCGRRLTLAVAASWAALWWWFEAVWGCSALAATLAALAALAASPGGSDRLLLRAIVDALREPARDGRRRCCVAGLLLLLLLLVLVLLEAGSAASRGALMLGRGAAAARCLRPRRNGCCTALRPRCRNALAAATCYRLPCNAPAPQCRDVVCRLSSVDSPQCHDRGGEERRVYVEAGQAQSCPRAFVPLAWPQFSNRAHYRSRHARHGLMEPLPLVEWAVAARSSPACLPVPKLCSVHRFTLHASRCSPACAEPCSVPGCACMPNPRLPKRPRHRPAYQWITALDPEP
jgi:hypothetical protein